MIIDGFFKTITRVFGSRNERVLKKFLPIVAAINAKEASYEKSTDAELRATTDILKTRLKDGETLDDILPDAFAAVREASRRTPPPGAEKGLRHFDVQLLGGIALHQGKIAEMVTGEGKTLVATCPVYLNALSGQGVHVITVNDYLARRDREWMGPIYERLGLVVGCIQADMSNAERKVAYSSDITYGTNNEFGFDYLRDNMKSSLEDQVQRRNFAVLDEVDNILIDEARTPLIISGPSEGDTHKYPKADRVARALRQDEHFEIKEKESSAILSEDGIVEAQRQLGVDSFYSGVNMEWPHLLEQALRAHHLFKKDVDYVVQPGENGQREVIIVDEFTGRLMAGRRWSDGLHQAVEAKERIAVRAENQTLATITFQNFFKLYRKLSGMTGTAITEAGEFMKIYKLDVLQIPTNKPLVRQDLDDKIYASDKDKFTALIDDIMEMHDARRPVLVGTTSIEKSEKLSDVLNRRGIEHEVLNAKHHAREAEIIAKAGEPGRVTIATNMAGRGTDIKLNPEVKERGGLHIIGTERHEARRIDNQLRGRAGRQGDPGTSRFYLSLEDQLMKRFAGPRISSLLGKLGLRDGQSIEHRWVTNSVERAQKKVEERNFEIRKRLLEYDEVMNDQRTQLYDFRQRILRGEGLKEMVMKMIEQSAERAALAHCPTELRPEDWDLGEISAWYKYKTREDASFEGVSRTQDAILNALDEQFDRLYDQREKQYGAETMRLVERWILLNAFDTRWKDHLLNMDALKSGIGLRAYASEDPKVAYRREGSTLYGAMLVSIEEEVGDLIFKVEVGSPEEDLETQDVWAGGSAHHAEFAEGRADMEAAAYQSQSQEAPKPFKREQPKVGRNDLCPCGSGQKFKKCCG